MGNSKRAVLESLTFLLVALVVLIPRSALGVAPETPTDINDAADPVDYIRHALDTHPIVCLSEGGHQAAEPHRFLRSVLGDTTILGALDLIVVEFAASEHQDLLDAYIQGDDFDPSQLSRVWRDTSQSPRVPWDSPLYLRLLETIRAGNKQLDADRRVRVLAGDPPIEWETITTREEYERVRIPRNRFVAELVFEQAFDRGKKVLIIYGGAHLPRAPIGREEDPRTSITRRILAEHPDAVQAIGFLIPENLGCENRIGELVESRIYETARHWVGGIQAERFFPGIQSLVTDPATGEQSWQEVPLYSGLTVRDLFDGLVYIGPSADWEYVPASLDPERDADYLNELNRRSLVRFGIPLSSRGE